MKIKNSIFAMSALSFACCTIAIAASTVTCPPASVVKANAAFVREKDTILVTVKQILTNAYVYDDKEWTTRFLFVMTVTKNNDSPLKYGEQLFAKTILPEPMLTQTEKFVSCHYGIAVIADTMLR